ncbi:hypothetical protein DPMN_148819 [Dreissena polymorpha]|uniref:Uncharacterized protein n=1 Tax=Dreissena polymorpha TaxID=45954 RepID=A0A9D4FET2_DREPO|nr:hypothetical protein DPMN_148819 [Dreissena polymorpha]
MLDPFNQLPESSANWEITIPESFTASGRLFTMRENRVGDITDPWGVPRSVMASSDNSPSTLTWILQPSRKALR